MMFTLNMNTGEITFDTSIDVLMFLVMCVITLLIVNTAFSAMIECIRTIPEGIRTLQEDLKKMNFLLVVIWMIFKVVVVESIMNFLVYE